MSSMQKKIAVLVRRKNTEALRTAMGATLADDRVTVFVMDEGLGQDEETALNLEMLESLKVKIYSNVPDDPFPKMSTGKIALLLPDFDVVIPY